MTNPHWFATVNHIPRALGIPSVSRSYGDWVLAISEAQMDPAILAATAGLIGSLVGGVSTFAASWLTQRGQLRLQMLVQQAVKREALYAEFIVEASKRVAEAWSHQAESPEAIAGLYSAVERMRLTSSAEVIAAAEEVIQQVIEAYAAPDLTFD